MKRLKYLATINPALPREVAPHPDDQVSFLPMEKISEQGTLDLSEVRPAREVSSGYTAIAEGDIIVAKITPCFENGKGALCFGLQGGVGYGTTELIVLRCTPQTDPRFLYWLTYSHEFRKWGEAAMTGSAGQKRVTEQFVANFLAPALSLEDQRRIASYLDAQTAKIDRLMDMRRRQIALLQEQRAAMIQQAVTRGLNPDVPMKNSGVQWLASIPSEWEKWKLSHACSLVLDGTHFSPESGPEGQYLYITAKNIKERGIDLSNVTYISEEEHNVIYSRCPVQKEDILYIKDGATAGIATVNNLDNEFSLLSSVALLRPKQSIITPKYLAYQLNSNVFKNRALNSLVGGAMTRFTLDIIGKFCIVAPTLAEQLAITAYLDEETYKIDQLIEKFVKAIAGFQEYRAALIHECVTGQREVPDMPAPLVEEANAL